MSEKTEGDSKVSVVRMVFTGLILAGAIGAYVWLSSAGPYGEVARAFIQSNAACVRLVGEPVSLSILQTNYSSGAAHLRNSAGGEDVVWLEGTISGSKGSAGADITIMADGDGGGRVIKVELSPGDGSPSFTITP